MSSYLSVWCKLIVYKTIIMPHLNYCASILFLLNKIEVCVLQRKQNHSIRYILRCDHYTSVAHVLKITDLSQNIFLNTMTVIYKILLTSIRTVSDVHGYHTRASDDFYVNRVSTEYSPQMDSSNIINCL